MTRTDTQQTEFNRADRMTAEATPTAPTTLTTPSTVERSDIDILAIVRAARADHDRVVFRTLAGWIGALFARNVGPRTNRARRHLRQDGLAGT